jgi:multiple sugar transport system substrate-binding protein
MRNSGSEPFTRRRFLSTTALGAGGLVAAPYLAGCADNNASPAGSGSGKSTSLSILAWSHTVPAVDVAFDQYAQDWGRKNNISVKVDHVAINDLPARLGTEISSKSGHDIVQMPPATGVGNTPDQLVDVSDLVEELGRDYGGWNSLAEQGAKYEGKWLAYPDYAGSKPGIYRKDLFDKYGLALPETWEDMRAAGKVLKKAGNPLALTLGHTGDSNIFWMSLLWSYGAGFAGSDGKYTPLDTPELRQALDVATGLYRDGCTKDVLAWDDAGNNDAMISGTSSYTINGISILAAAKEGNPDVAKNLALCLPPGGPATRAVLTNQFMLGIWNFSKAQDVAMDFLRAYHKEWKMFAEVSGGFNMKLFKDIPRPYPVVDDNPVTEGLVDQVQYLAAVGYPGPASNAANEVASTFLITDMVSKVVQGGSVDSAIADTDSKIKAIYEKANLV